ncbi:hypothetical protein KR009_010391 [Drosophila setifemur]|nr:hypothetical protein KR009_010391 [Drosophila setifemur]
MSEIAADEKPKVANLDKPKSNRRKDKKDRTNHIVKIVMRHLPPTMTEEQFLDQVGPLSENDSYYFCPADWSLGQEATCRAYIDMSHKDNSEVLQFRDRFDGYVFVDNRGAEYVAIVEYAPFQSFLKNKARNDDSKVNTIESESHYQEFIQRLAEEREEASRLGDVKIDFNFERRTDEKCKTTPLIQYLANKKEKRREEARKRNEEKRKQREEQQKLRQLEQADGNKSKEGSAGGDNKKPAKKDGKDPQSAAQGPEKTGRSKRRAERDQRRREEHERKLARERDQKDKKDKPERQDKPEKEKTSGGKHGKKQLKDLSKSDKDIVILKKDAKFEDKDNAQSPSCSIDASKEGAVEKACDVPDAVKKFIQAAGSLTDKGDSGAAGEQEEPRYSMENSEDAAKTASFRSSEERRIRNKDRPSIAIYQPKARNRGGGEEGSQNTKYGSDGEASIAPEEKSSKKSRRSGRRNKPKPQECKDSQLQARRTSKSSESSNSANSTNIVK